MAATITPVASGDTPLDAHQDIFAALSTSSHSFLQPSAGLHTAAILAAKNFIDPLASSISEAQERRKRENGKKRKRSDYEADSSVNVLKLREVYTAGFGVDQIWEQAKRILDAASDEVERDLRSIQASRVAVNGVAGKPQPTNSDVKMVHFDREGLETGLDPDEDALDGDAELNLEGDVNSVDDELLQAGDREFEDDDDDMASEEIDDSLDSREHLEEKETPQTYVPDPNGLNDGFFSIDDFNKQSQFLEQRDALGGEDNLSDEDEIDWDANPLTRPLPLKSGKKELQADEAMGSADGNAPTFGDADLDVSSEKEEDDNLDLGDSIPGLDNTNDIRYADFFEPPAQKLSKSKRMRSLPKTQPPARPNTERETVEDIDVDMQRAISDVRRDLLDSEDEPSSMDDDNDEDQQIRLSTTQNLSTHEKQRAKIAAEIRRLEAAAISKRDWTLSGEARAADRPVNSLIEEDLEFERAGKPVPVITAEVSEEIEALIKRRIVAREFDEVVRRRPDATAAVSAARRGRVELDDTRPSQGLAEVYEAEHLKATDPGYVDKRSAALKKQHDQIATLWKDVSAKLDVLSNLHFKPKRVEIGVQVVTDKPTISMEDARPGAADGGGTESRLAPQEIYTPGEEGKGRGEIMGKSGMAKSKEEMTKEEKLRRRRRDKERAKKTKGNEAVASQKQSAKKGKHAAKAQQKKNILDELRKGGVKIIGKRGDVQEIEGKKRRGQGEAEPRSTAYKL